MDINRFKKRGYVKRPTYIEPLNNLTKLMNKNINLYVKRDDLLESGGNKTRKLDYLIADAIEKGCDTLITCGAVQSNHCRITLSWANLEKMDCHLIIEERVKGSYKEDANGNNFLFHLMGAKSIKMVPGKSDMMAEMEKKAEELRKEGKKPYIVPGGGSNGIGALGYSSCALELMEQLAKESLDIDTIVVPSGSSGTHAGMAVALKALNSKINLVGINVSRTTEEQKDTVFKVAQEHIEVLGLDKNILRRDDLICIEDYVGEGYSLKTEGMKNAVEVFAREESILLDPVYTGKVADGFLDLIKKDYFKEGSNVLFLHTGGSIALYAYQNYFKD
ncbi:D-cysteine desulfhydrase [Arcobacter sp. YIC-310]|uniref:D-cysteine desulfhydrase n=1 Tax=Arcobacter sp. YIC-310 TaxID=3376632 RepID=UPI003C1CA2AB